MTRLLPITIVLAALLPAAGFALSARWLAALLCVLIGAAWVVGARSVYASRMASPFGWPAAVGFVLLVGLSGLGALSNIPLGWGVAGVLGALAAWDLSAFAGRMAGAGRVVDAQALWRTHIRQLGVALGIGVVLAVATLVIRIDLGFTAALALGVVAVVALSQAVRSSFRY